MKARAVLGGLSAAVLMTACSSNTTSGDSAPKEVTGPVLEVDGESLGDVTSFEVKEQDESYQIFIDPDVNYGFNLGHINEHLASGEPVRVGIDSRDGKLFATVIVDAGGGP